MPLTLISWLVRLFYIHFARDSVQILQDRKRSLLPFVMQIFFQAFNVLIFSVDLYLPCWKELVLWVALLGELLPLLLYLL